MPSLQMVVAMPGKPFGEAAVARWQRVAAVVGNERKRVTRAKSLSLRRIRTLRVFRCLDVGAGARRKHAIAVDLPLNCGLKESISLPISRSAVRARPLARCTLQ